MGTALAIAGWLAFACAVAAAVLVRHALSARSEAVARACHEVRGSLTAARLGLEWGSGGVQPPGSRLRAIELELERAAAALDYLQEVDRPSESEPVAELVDVRSWLLDSVEAFRPLADGFGMQLDLKWRGPGGEVRGRRARLAQASDNLIANAIEHGGSPIEVRAAADAGRIRIEVLDGGQGLSQAAAHVLQSAETPGRIPRRRRRRKSRRGRGLLIAREVAVEHGGTLTAAPSGQGARLVLELPLAETA